jgi:hypothetical protein
MRLLLLPALLFGFLVNAQNFHFSARLGLAGYQGDLKEHAISLKQNKLFGSLGARYDLSEHITARSYISYGSLQGDDKKGTTVMQQRNLNFKTKLLDFELGAQYNFFSLNNRWWTPYVFAGVGFFHYNPYTFNSNDEKVFLAPLSTEGQGFLNNIPNYKLTQFSVPFGFGADYSINEDMRIGLEFGYRKLFTDYLDDVSTDYVEQSGLFRARGQQAVDMAWRGDEYNGAPYPAGGITRGSPKYKDGYYYIAVTYTVRYFFDQYKAIAGIPSGKRDKKVGCPASSGY